MPATVWKGHLTFGLVTIPIKLYRAARAKRVGFRQFHRATGTPVRQAYTVDAAVPEPEVAGTARLGSIPPQPSLSPGLAVQKRTEPASGFDLAEPPKQVEVPRSEVVKGFEVARDQFVTVTAEELEELTPRTSSDMQILEFVHLRQVDPVYFENSYYVGPDRGGEKAYALLFEALRQTGLAALAQFAMHNREHVALVRPGVRGLVLHTLFYEDEVNRNDEYPTEVTAVNARELELAVQLTRALETTFDPGKYKDTYRERVEELVRGKVQRAGVVEPIPTRSAPVVNILEALQRSLTAASQAPPRKPVAQQRKTVKGSGKRSAPGNR